jgi:hypothetical protein
MKKILPILVVLISAATVVSGAIQMLWPSFVLGLVGGEITATTLHFFRIIGMFMLLFGAVMLTTVYDAVPSRTTVLWCALQKLGASAAVIWGVTAGIFQLQAAAVAGFDGISGLIFLYFMYILRTDESA